MRSLAGSTIVFLNNFAGPHMGGGEVLLLRLIAAAREAGMHVHVICEPGGTMEAEARALGVTVAPYELGRRNVLRTASRVRKYLVRHGADLVHSNGYFTNLLSRRAARRTRAAVVNSVLCEPDSSALAGGSLVIQWLRDLADRLTARWAHLLIPVSEQVAAALEARGVPRERMEVIRNAVDTAALEEEAARSRAPLSRSPGTRLVGTIARLEAVTGLDDFIRMAALVAAEREEARFAIVGVGPLRDGLEELAGGLGLGERLTFAGFVESAVGALCSMDLLVLSSLSEGLPTTVLEAMALGKPVVATDVGGVDEVVDDGVTGLLVPPRDPHALARAVLRVLGDSEVAVSMGKSGRSRVIDEFSAETMVERHLAEYRKLLDRR